MRMSKYGRESPIPEVTKGTVSNSLIFLIKKKTKF